jgi:hypothetical protein
MNFIVRLCVVLFFIIHIAPSCAATITWEATETGATGVDGTKTYTYNPNTPLSYEGLTGPVKCVDTATGISWVAQLFLPPYISLGSFFWQMGQTSWSYDAILREWSIVGNNLIWVHPEKANAKKLPGDNGWVFNQTKTNDRWSLQYMPEFEGFEHYWMHSFYAGSLDGFFERWGYNATDDTWTNITRSTAWQLNQELLQWTRSGTDEVWQLNPTLETMTLIGDGVEANRWRHVYDDVWLEEPAGIEWRYTAPGSIAAESVWQNMATNETWSFNTDTQIWIHDGGTLPSRSFPPLAPPLFAHHINTLLLLYDELQTHVLPLTSPNGEYTLTSDGYTFKFHTDDSFDLTIPALSAHVGTGARYGYTADFETSLGEKWEYISHGWYTNISNGAGAGEKIYHLYTLNIWAHVGSFFHWRYNSTADTWALKNTSCVFNFDINTFTWTNTITNTEWKTVFDEDEEKWVWKNSTDNELWTTIVSGPPGKEQVVWHNITTDSEWNPSIAYEGDIEIPACKNMTTNENWIYNQATGLWRAESDLEGNELELFPFLPGTIAGCIEFITKNGRAETTSISPFSEELGVRNRAIELQEEFDALHSTFNNTITEYTGEALYEQLLTEFPTIEAFTQQSKTLCEEYLRFTAPLGMRQDLQTTIPAAFTEWNTTGWVFDTPGKGACMFSLFMSSENELVIGLAPEPTTDGTATYTISLLKHEIESDGPSITLPLYNTYYDVAFYKDGTLLYSQSYTWSVDRFGPAQPNDLKLWFTYSNGQVRIGIQNPVETTLSDTDILLIAEYTIEDGSTPNTIQYFNFKSASANIRELHTYNLDVFNTQLHAAELFHAYKNCMVLTPAETAWINVKEEFNTIATAPLSYREKTNEAQTLFDDLLEHDFLPFIPSNNRYSNAYVNYITASLGFAIGSLKTYLIFTTDNLYGYDESITALLTSTLSPLSQITKEALFMDAQLAATEFIFFASDGRLESIRDDSASIIEYSKNADFAPYRNFIIRETEILENISRGLETYTGVMLSRLFAETPVTIGWPDLEPEDAPTLDELKALEAAAKADTIHILTEQVTTGAVTPFSAVAAAGMLFFINSNFDDVRITLTNYLTEHEYTTFYDYAAVGSSFRNHTATYTLFTEILRDLEPLLRTTGNVFTPPFQGTSSAPTLTITEGYMTSTVTSGDTTTVTDQQQTVANGSAAYLKNSSISTESHALVRTSIKEILGADVAKDEVYSRVYIKDALVALGNGNYTKDSKRALSLLGATEITPEGNCVITLNSDIIISGPNFLRPTSNFGYDEENATRCIPAVPASRRGHHEITFYAPVERTITIASETEFDLSAFAQGLVANGQRITFAGKAKLIFEPNTRLRLPYTTQSNRDYALTIAFKDEAELIFQGIENYDISGFTDALSGPDLVRSKILGCGILEFSGNAQAKILRSALVGIEADYTSHVTDIEIKLTDNSKWLMGTSTISGGGLQVGNIFDGGSNSLDPDNYPNNSTHERYGDAENPFVPRPAQVDFTLTLTGTNPEFYIGRGAFVGFGVGTVNKEGIINGTESTDPWLIQSLYNTGNITLNLLSGTLWHQNVADGDDAQASLFAVGPHMGRTRYRLTMNKKKNTLIRGGGNVLFARTNYTEPAVVSIDNTIQSLAGDMTDSGKHSLLAPRPVIMLRQEPDPDHPGFAKYGNASIIETANEYQISGQYDDFFNAITLKTLAGNGKYAIAHTTNGENQFTLVDSTGTVISTPIKLRQVTDQSRKKVTRKNVASEGFVRSSVTTASPKRLTKPKAQ